MDNMVYITIGGVEYDFKLKSSSILYLEKKLGRNIFEAFQAPDFTVVCHLFYACANAKCKVDYKTEGELFDALLAEYGLNTLIEKYMQEIVEKSGLVQKQATPTEEAKTWAK